MSSVDSDTLDSLVASHRGLKGNLTRKLNTADRALAQAQVHGPSQVKQNELAELKIAITGAYDKVEASLCKMQDLAEEKDFGEYEAKIEEEWQRSDKVLGLLVETMARFEPLLAPVAPAAPAAGAAGACLLYTSPSPRDKRQSRMPSSA